jgi:hypothetical protein
MLKLQFLCEVQSLGVHRTHLCIVHTPFLLQQIWGKSSSGVLCTHTLKKKMIMLLEKSKNDFVSSEVHCI